MIRLKKVSVDTMTCSGCFFGGTAICLGNPKYRCVTSNDNEIKFIIFVKDPEGDIKYVKSNKG